MRSLVLVMCLSLAAAQFGEQQQGPQLTAEEAFGIAVARLDPCERAIWSCCQSDRATFLVPSDCFAANGCYGLHWIGHRACAPEMVNAVGRVIQNQMVAELRAAATRRRGQTQTRIGSFFP